MYEVPVDPEPEFSSPHLEKTPRLNYDQFIVESSELTYKVERYLERHKLSDLIIPLKSIVVDEKTPITFFSDLHLSPSSPSSPDRLNNIINTIKGSASFNLGDLFDGDEEPLKLLKDDPNISRFVGALQEHNTHHLLGNHELNGRCLPQPNRNPLLNEEIIRELGQRPAEIVFVEKRIKGREPMRFVLNHGYFFRYPFHNLEDPYISRYQNYAAKGLEVITHKWMPRVKKSFLEPHNKVIANAMDNTLTQGVNGLFGHVHRQEFRFPRECGRAFIADVGSSRAPLPASVLRIEANGEERRIPV